MSLVLKYLTLGPTISNEHLRFGAAEADRATHILHHALRLKQGAQELLVARPDVEAEDAQQPQQRDVILEHVLHRLLRQYLHSLYT
jgi:hypothetical protein